MDRADARWTHGIQQDLHERIAKALGWTPGEVRSFSLLTLRAILQDKHPKLARDITEFIRSGGALRELQ